MRIVHQGQLLFICLIICQTTLSQVNASQFYKNLPTDIVFKGLQDLDNANFRKNYNISRDSFLMRLEPYLKDSLPIWPGKIRASNGNTYEIVFDSCCFYDLLGIFEKSPGDCGWVPGQILFSITEGKEKLAKSFLLNFQIELGSIDENIYEHLLRAKKNYTIPDSFTYYVCMVPRMLEEQIVEEMRKSGLFLYASRSAAGCGGGIPNVVVKRTAVFGKSKPNREAGTKFINDVFKRNLSSSIKISLVAVQDFSYDIILLGPSTYLSIGKSNLWEKFEINISFQNGFELSPDEMEILIDVKSIYFAKGKANNPPPSARFDEPNDLHINTLSDEIKVFINMFITDLAKKAGGRLN
jgi:hypothetical protein